MNKRAEPLPEETDGEHIGRRKQRQSQRRAPSPRSHRSAAARYRYSTNPGALNATCASARPSSDGDRRSARGARRARAATANPRRASRRAISKVCCRIKQKGGGHDIARIAAGRIEQRLREHGYRLRARQRVKRETAVGARASGEHAHADVADRLGDAAEHPAVEDQIGGIDIGRQMHVVALEQVALGVARNSRMPKTRRAASEPLAVGERRRPFGHLQRLVGVQASARSRALSAVPSSSTTAIGICRTSWPR